MTPLITLSRALTDSNLFGGVFGAPSFWTWRTVAKLIDGAPLRELREIDLFKQCTGRSQLPGAPVRRLILLAGRRAGKDRFLSACAVWRAALCADWRKYISAGEQAVVLLLGADRKQAGILRHYCEGLPDTPAPPQQRTDNAQQCRYHKALMRNIATQEKPGPEGTGRHFGIFSTIGIGEEERVWGDKTPLPIGRRCSVLASPTRAIQPQDSNGRPTAARTINRDSGVAAAHKAARDEDEKRRKTGTGACITRRRASYYQAARLRIRAYPERVGISPGRGYQYSLSDSILVNAETIGHIGSANSTAVPATKILCGPLTPEIRQ